MEKNRPNWTKNRHSQIHKIDIIGQYVRKWTQLGNLDIRLGKIEQNDKARKNTYVEARCTETLALLKKATFFPKLIFIHRRKKAKEIM